VSAASVAQADDAVEAAYAAFPRWRDTPVAERARLLDRAADILERDRFEIAALQTYEVGKPWAEADADVAEAIDFCRYYARQALVELAPHAMDSPAGEKNVLYLEGRGPTVVIAPWNFPSAIFCGMSVANLVAGNPVILKPAEQSSAVGYRMYRALMEAGLPEEVVQFLPGVGEEIGPRLVQHPLVANIAFTGSKAVGLSIVQAAAVTHPGQPEVKRAFCEMGGKNAIIVDRDAEPDETMAGIIRSAFGYAGQKCSACSRVILVGPDRAEFEDRLVASVKCLVVGSPEDPACHIPPLVDPDARERLRNAHTNPGTGAEALYVGEAPEGGYFVPPAVFRVTDPNHDFMQKEYFGPLLAVYRVDTFDEALAVANAPEYALTGGVYSRTPSHLQQAAEQFRVGNLYLNRPITGAIVNRQPFGGSRMSGTGTKAGGPGYLSQFSKTRLVSENTVRRGFTPDVEF
jgi:RHH-type proline utilization regulon transcriptional repressor/proline dehydrogenase/delta 1-pyrroline-5-carboxylate dehydrogenase